MRKRVAATDLQRDAGRERGRLGRCRAARQARSRGRMRAWSRGCMRRWTARAAPTRRPALQRRGRAPRAACALRAGSAGMGGSRACRAGLVMRLRPRPGRDRGRPGRDRGRPGRERVRPDKARPKAGVMDCEAPRALAASTCAGRCERRGLRAWGR